MSCFQEEDGLCSIWAGHDDVTAPPAQYYNGLLAFLGRRLPANGFVGLVPPNADPSRSVTSLAAIQLLDGVLFTVDNFHDASLPAETQISAGEIRALYRGSVCTDAPTLPDCR